MTRDKPNPTAATSGNIKPRELLDGHIIRFDEDRQHAFVFIDHDVSGEYRWVNCQELHSIGPIEEGQVFVLRQKKTDSGSQDSLFLPAEPYAMTSEEDLAERNKRVDEHIKTLDELKVDAY